MKKVLGYILIPIIFILIGWFGRVLYTLPKSSNLVTQTISVVKPTPLLKYTIENLSNRDFNPSIIEVGDIIKEYDTFTSYVFKVSFSPDFSDNLKTVSGVINIPSGNGHYPVIVMFRGYVDPTIYFMGQGTQPSASVYAQNGYITIAPDFLGYGQSDKEAEDVFESRFQTYVTAVTLLKSVSDSAFVKSTGGKWDGKNIFIWGHSNGGQIALTTLEVTGVSYPTTLWAPVSMRFPASILYYVGDSEDGGKFLISKLAKFEEIYDAEEFSMNNYYDKIKAPIQINQGTADTAVPYWLTNDLFDALKDATVSATYLKYEGSDHNMRPNWNDVVENNLKFFEENLK